MKAMGPEPWKPVFLEALRDTMSVWHAAKVAGVGRSTVNEHRQSDPGFSEAWENTWRCVVEQLEASAMKRAVQGWIEPVYHQGKQVGFVQRFDNRLTWNMLQKWKRERYGDEVPSGASEEQIAATIRAFIAAARAQDDAENGPQEGAPGGSE